MKIELFNDIQKMHDFCDHCNQSLVNKIHMKETEGGTYVDVYQTDAFGDTSLLFFINKEDHLNIWCPSNMQKFNEAYPEFQEYFLKLFSDKTIKT